MHIKRTISSMVVVALLVSAQPTQANPSEAAQGFIESYPKTACAASAVTTALLFYGIMKCKSSMSNNFTTKKAIYDMLFEDYQKLVLNFGVSVNQVGNQQLALVVPQGARVMQNPVNPTHGQVNLTNKARDYHRWFMWHDATLDALIVDFYTHLGNRSVEQTRKALETIFGHLFW